MGNDTDSQHKSKNKTQDKGTWNQKPLSCRGLSSSDCSDFSRFLVFQNCSKDSQAPQLKTGPSNEK